jgi:UDP-N-acetylglucosamine 2-epimerase (non-hydrolysing)
MGRQPLVVHVVGARPNYMKIAPIWAELERRGSCAQRLVHTGQHYDPGLKDVFFAELPLPEPDVELGIGSGSHAEQTGRALIELEKVFANLQPDLVVVPGDVNSTLAGALAATKLGIDVCHVEAGLRSFDRSMPEEHNRRLTDHLSTLLLTHSESAVANLAAEGIAGDNVVFVGNTMIDSLVAARPGATALAAWEQFELSQGDYVLVTLHRPSLVDVPELLAETFEALAVIAEQLPVIFPLHPRTQARLAGTNRTDVPNLSVVEPLPYSVFLSLEIGAAAVVTDSGGVQEETTALGVPCFTLRDNTERPITVTDGTNTILGLNPRGLRSVPDQLARQPARQLPALWDGHAAIRAADAIERALGASG